MKVIPSSKYDIIFLYAIAGLFTFVLIVMDILMIWFATHYSSDHYVFFLLGAIVLVIIVSTLYLILLWDKFLRWIVKIQEPDIPLPAGSRDDGVIQGSMKKLKK